MQANEKEHFETNSLGMPWWLHVHAHTPACVAHCVVEQVGREGVLVLAETITPGLRPILSQRMHLIQTILLLSLFLRAEHTAQHTALRVLTTCPIHAF